VDVPLARQLALTHKALHAWTDAVLATHGSSLTTWIVLHNASLAPSPGLSQRELADGMGIGGPALVRHIDRLEAEGYVARTRDAADRRITRITLTPAGRRLHGRLTTRMKAIDAELRSSLTTTELRTLQRALTKIARFADETPITKEAETP
jgi:MarR family transcriptional regulator for hemolysin